MERMDSQNANKLRKVLGVAFGLAVVVGSTIGVGILRTPGSIAALIPDKELIIGCWVIMGLYILLSASSYAELTTMLPKAGGAYNYIKRAFGSYAGFITGWFDFLSNAIAPAYFCIVLAEYSILIFPQIKEYGIIISAAFLTLLTLINLPGVKSGSAFQKISSAIKVILFLVLIIGCFANGQINGTSTANNPEIHCAAMAVFGALQLILGTYDGWMSVSFFAEEDQNPGKNIPKSYLFGAMTIGILYVLINAAILYALPVESVARSPLAAADAASAAFGSWSGVFMTSVAIFSLISILNAYMMIPSRILFGLARDGFFIRRATLVNTGGTPYFSLFICYFFALLLICFSSFETLFGLAVVMMTIVTGFAFASLIRLRKTEPDLPRPYRAFGYPFTTYIALLVTCVLFVAFAFSDTFSFVVVVGCTVFSWIGYRLFYKSPAEQ